MSVEKVRHAQRECLSERVIWFACALVKEKVEMCAGIMDFSVLFKFIASIVSFFYCRQYIRDTLENGSPVCSTAGGDGIESSSGLTVQWVSAVNVSGLRRQSHTACMTTSSLSTV